ncbi:unnamed protein product [Moneuplotes crassus]|uniref:Hexose transporter 1 n=1 Tax=Euplotes crassus TaxID=5936 RepID=A0AAD1UBL0_EUPCR|nr:unnamed protein product [Moneuplotes crassus]
MVRQNINKPYLITMAMTVALGFCMLGYCFGYYNAFTDITYQKYAEKGQQVIHDKNLFNSLVSGLIPFGAIFGSVMIGLIVNKGRRFSLLVVASVFMAATLLSLVFNFYAMVLGRLCMGICIGCYATLCPLYISEISPPELSGFLGVFNQMGACTGIVIAFIVPYIMPLSETPTTTNLEPKAVVDSHNWRLIFGFPFGIALTQFLLLFFIFKDETPLFYLKKGDKSNYYKTMRKIYMGWEPEEDIELNEVQENNNSSQQNKPSEEESLVSSCHEKQVQDTQPGYKKALLIGSVLSLMHQFTGINSVIFFSSEIFTVGRIGLDAAISARAGTLLVGIVGFLGTGLSIPLQKYFGRVTFIQFSEVILCASLALSGICACMGSQFGIITFTLVFIFMFNFGYGQALWIYCAEVLDSRGCAIVALLNMISTWIFGTFTNLAFKYLTPQGVYFGLAAIQVFTITFVWAFVKETKGKTKQECEQLYAEKD